MIPESNEPESVRNENHSELTAAQALMDVIVVGGGSFAYVIASLFSAPVLWIVVAVVAVLGWYGVFVLARRRHAWSEYGVRTDNLRIATKWIGNWTAVCVALAGVSAVLLKHSLNRPEVFILLALYPFWGIVQQFIFQGILHRALLRLCNSRWLALLLCAVAFSSVHVADIRVVGLTFIGGLFWSWFYQRFPNIWILGLSHATIGAFVYPWLLAENPLESFF